jgi:uncharacterized delta-60 repeat protein
MERNMTTTLDNTFGVGGIVTTDIGGYLDGGSSVIVQSDGKILVAGAVDYRYGKVDFGLIRYNTNGSLDTSFSSDGKVTTDFGDYDEGSSVTVQNDGKILVAGHAFNSNNDYSDFALVRYNINGSLDTSFSSDGKVTTDVGRYDDVSSSVAVQNDGKILVAGDILDSNFNSDFGLVRYNANGALDKSFGSFGKVTIGIGDYSDYVTSMTLQSDGKILVAGSASNSFLKGNFALVRYNANGSLDTSFSSDGKVTTDFGGNNSAGGNSVIVQSNGKILVAGFAYDSNGNSDFALARYNANGSLDTSFSSDGKVTTDFAGYTDFANSVIVQSDGKILVAGYVSNSSDENSDNSDFGLVRYNANGTLDMSFGTEGKYTIDVGFSDNGQKAVLQNDGKIVMVGTSNSDFAVVRLNNTISTTSNKPTAGADKIIGTAGADTIDGLAGNDTISGVGGNDRLIGSGGDDSINGGTGDDTMIGGPGNDTYIVNSVRDRTIEALNAGTDRIFSTVTYTLPTNVENLNLQGTQAINGTGNTLPNSIIGNSAANRINGGGGNDILNGGGGNDVFLVNPGNDRLTGGTGADRFIYNTNATFTRTAVGVDTITDFIISQNDKIVLDKTTFPKITSANGTGFSRDVEFAKVNTDAKAAISGADIVYNTATGALFYNQNGTATGFGTGGKFAVLSNKPNLTENQFIIQA